jgi:predicted amidophosphoribosyltransferase
MKHLCSVCGKPVSRKLSMTKNLDKHQELICLPCIKKIDPIAYIFVLQSIERNLIEELKNHKKESQSIPNKPIEKQPKHPISKISA